MSVQPVESIEDPRLSAFRCLKDRTLAREGGRFIAEGEHLVRRLLASRFITESVLLADRRLAELGPIVPEHVPVYVAPPRVLDGVVGFKFHSGVLACGQRGPGVEFHSLVPDPPAPVRLVLCEEVNNAENLGGIIRVAAGLGADALVLGQRCIDPFNRQSIRVSMGAIFQLPIVQSKDFLADLRDLSERHRVELIAMCLAADALPLARMQPSARMGILLGSEAQGLSAAAIACCDQRVMIPMRLGTDSLNVAVAAGIAMHHFWSNLENAQ